MLADPELRDALQRAPLVERVGPWVRAVDAHLLTSTPPGAPAGAPPEPLWGGGARLHGGRFTPKGSFDTLYLASDLLTLGLEIGAVLLSGRRDGLPLAPRAWARDGALRLRADAV